MENTIDYYYSIKEIQTRLNISRSTVLRLINSGKLTSIKIGRQIRIPET